MNGLLRFLPAPPSGKTGWPWDIETVPVTYSAQSEWPRVCIVTPSFNQGAFVEETIRSVLLQNYPNLQYLVIDGGSTDGTVELIKKYSPWLDYWVSEPDRGQSHAINKGLARCDGCWFNWINSDDCLLSGGLAAIGRARQTCIILSAAELTGTDLHDPRPLGRTQIGPTLEDTLVRHYICQQGLFFRTDEVRALHGVREDLHYVMDLELLMRLLLRHGLQCVTEIPEEIAFFRLHNKAKTLTAKDKFIEEERALFHDLARVLGLSPQLLRHMGGAMTPAGRWPDVSRLNSPRLSCLLAEKFWWNGPVERAWRLREFATFKSEIRSYLLAFPDETTERVAKLRRMSQLPQFLLHLLSLLRANT